MRELYRPQPSPGEEDAAWHAGLDDELATPRRGAARRGSADDRDRPEPKSTGPLGPERTGTVVQVTSGACRVERESGEVDCVLPSSLARGQRAAVAVGDEVVFSAHGDGIHRVERVLPRRTTLSRPDPLNARLERVIAANVDVAVHVASVVEPPLRPALIDRYLIAIGRGGAEAAVCVNKIDLLEDSAARRQQLERLDPYRELGVTILPCSAVTGEGLDRIRALLAGRTAVFVGHSGVGKSSILNALDPGLEAATGPVSDRRGTGQHTTSRSSLYRLKNGIRVIDTPGIRELGLWRLTAEELRAHFPDFDEHAARCRFADCSHSHEPDCGVRAAAHEGAVARARFDTYLRILGSLETPEP